MQKRTVTGKPPAYLHHRAKDRGFAYYRDEGGARRRRYFPGPHGSPESRRAYLDFLSAWESGAIDETQTSSPANDTRLTVGEIVAAFLDWADVYYVKNGEPTGEADNHRFAVEQLVELFGDTPAAEFGPKRLRAVRDAMERSGRLSRRTVNHRIGRVRHVFKWAVAEEMVPGGVYQALRALPALQPGRSKAREKAPVEPVPEDQIEAVLPFLTPTLRAMVRFAYFTGARPYEVCSLRWTDVDRTDAEAWVYRVRDHKNFHRGHERVVGIGRRAQEILEPFRAVDPDAPIFSPIRSERERRALRRQERKTPLTPSQRQRDRERRDRPRRKLAGSYTRDTFRQAVHRGCDAANAGRLREAIAAAVAALVPHHDGLQVDAIAVEHLIDRASGRPLHQRPAAAGDVEHRKLRALLERVLGGTVPATELARTVDAATKAVTEMELPARWSPGQLRHNFEDRTERVVGMERTSRAMGHSTMATTERYRTKKKVREAKEVAKLLG